MNVFLTTTTFRSLPLLIARYSHLSDSPWFYQISFCLLSHPPTLPRSPFSPPFFPLSRQNETRQKGFVNCHAPLLVARVCPSVRLFVTRFFRWANFERKWALTTSNGQRPNGEQRIQSCILTFWYSLYTNDAQSCSHCFPTCLKPNFLRYRPWESRWRTIREKFSSGAIIRLPQSLTAASTLKTNAASVLSREKTLKG